MEPASLAHSITAQEAQEFAEQGFLVLGGALSQQAVSALRCAVERFEARTAPNQTSSYYNYADILGLDDAFLDVIDHPCVFPKVIGLLGFNIQINHSHVNIDPPSQTETAFAWHRDGAMAMWDLPRPMPLLGVKVGIYLSDINTPDCGNTFVLPGSHRTPDLPLPPHGSRPADAVAVQGPVGTVLIMDPRIIHCRGANRATHPRKAIFLQYAFRWLRPLDAMRVEALRDRCFDLIRRQLLGFDVGETSALRSGTWYPQDRDVPLRRWLIDNWGGQAAGRVGLLTGLPARWFDRELPTKPSQY